MVSTSLAVSSTPTTGQIQQTTNVKQIKNNKLCVSGVQNEPTKDTVSFKGRDEAPKEGRHVGLVAGCIAGAVESVGTAMMLGALPAVLVLGGSIACGAIVDKIISNKREDFARFTQGKSAKEVLQQDDKSEISRYGGLYYRANEGKKWGPLLGAILFPLVALTNTNSEGGKGKAIIMNLFTGAVSGLIMGAITDKISNNKAEREADKKVYM